MLCICIHLILSLLGLLLQNDLVNHVLWRRLWIHRSLSWVIVCRIVVCILLKSHNERLKNNILFGRAISQAILPSLLLLAPNLNLLNIKLLLLNPKAKVHLMFLIISIASNWINPFMLLFLLLMLIIQMYDRIALAVLEAWNLLMLNKLLKGTSDFNYLFMIWIIL